MKIAVSKTLNNIIINLRQLEIEVIDIEEAESLHDINEELDAIIIDGQLPYHRLSSLLEEAREHNLITCMDHIASYDIEDKKNLLKNIDIFCPNKEETFLLCENDCTTLDEIHKQVKQLLEQGTKMVAVTLGNDGVFFATKQVRKLIPAYIVAVGDEDGAGDGFIAGVFYGLKENYDMEKAVHCGVVAGAITAASYGDYSFELKPEKVEDIIKDRVKL